MTEIVDVLRRARALIAEPERWVKNSTALDRSGNPCDPRHSCAARWCAMGALTHEAKEYLTVRRAHAILASVLGCSAVVEWNDKPRVTHAKVLAAFDAAIAAAEKKVRL